MITLNKITSRFSSDINLVIQKIPFLSLSVHSFILSFNEEATKQTVKFCFELKEKLSFIELGLVYKEVSDCVLKEIRNLNSQRTDSMSLCLQNDAIIEFYSLGQGPFLHPIA